MDDDFPEIKVVSLDQRTVTLADGTVLPATDFIDKFGDDCEPIDAVVCIAGSDDFGWMQVDILPLATVH